MAWTNPRTWTAGEVLTDALLNAQLRDNLSALKAPTATDINDITVGSNYTTTSTTFTNVATASNTFEVTITPDAGGATTWVMVWARFSVRPSGSATVRSIAFDLTKDGTSVSAGNGLLVARGNVDDILPVSLIHWEQVSGALPVTFRLQWKVENAADTATIFTQVGGANNNRPQFGAREVS